MPELTPTQDALSPIPDEALKALRREWATIGPLGQMTYPQYCEKETIFARRMVALLVNYLSLRMNKNEGDDANLMELLQTAAASSVAWIGTVGAASATLGTTQPT